MLYNEIIKWNNVIINLIVKKDSVFFVFEEINVFFKIKMDMIIVSLFGVGIYGLSEFYFINLVKIEGDFINIYKINFLNFILKGMFFIFKED